jgi:hypothetical protein
MSDYKRGLDWSLDLLNTYRSKLQVITVLLLIYIHQLLSGNGFQRRSFPTFRVLALTGRRLSPN